MFNNETIYNLFNQMRDEICSQLNAADVRAEVLEKRLCKQHEKNQELATMFRMLADKLEENL